MNDQKVFKKLIKYCLTSDLKLQSKKMPLIAVDQTQNTLKYIRPGQEHQISGARTTQPLQPHSAVSYFQVKILNCKRRSDIGIGLISKDCALKKHPGQSKFSIGYLSSGEVLYNRNKITTTNPFTKGDVVGAGINYAEKEIFITLNGVIKTKVNGLDDSGNWNKFYPCVSLHYQGEQAKLLFDQSQFIFRFRQYRQQAENKIFKQISSQNCNFDDIYSIVGDYLSFHGYLKSVEMLKQQKPQIFSEISFIRHPYHERKLWLNDNKFFMENFPNGQQLILEKDYSQEDINENKVITQRHRIMSDYWGYMVPDELPRKNTLQQERLLLESRRKSSYISNGESMLKLVDEQDANHQNQLNQNDQKSQRFLKQTRPQILNLIRAQKIQQAAILIETIIPYLFSLNENLTIYFKIHIFLRKIKRQGSSAAIQYARNLREEFLKYKDCKFPQFYRGQLTWVTFQEIIGAIRFEKDPNYQPLTSSQFQCFSNYVNELIMKGFGYYDQSKLSLMINHLKSIQTKTHQHQINGPSFNINF